MKLLHELTFGFTDAENYRRRENKNLFDQIFLRTDSIDDIKKPSTFFLVGEKGTGKTAYAVFFHNHPDTKFRSHHKFIRETDYLKFVSLKAQRHLVLSDYTDIWKVIICLLLAGEIINQPDRFGISHKNDALNKLAAAIDEYYENAFSPEIISALRLIDDAEAAAKIFGKIMETGIGTEASRRRRNLSEQSKKRFQTSLLRILNNLEDGLSSVRLASHAILFIDGIDIRPDEVPFGEYLGCVKGLANAVWSLNNDFFPSIRDSRGRFRVILLVRPDIFNSLGLQNRNTKLRDNSTILDWRTDYGEHRESSLFRLADKFFSAQQKTFPRPGIAWDHYFPFDAKSLEYNDARSYFSSFVVLLRYSFHRPRDILSIFETLEKLYVKGKKDKAHFQYQDLISQSFRRDYGNYMLGEIKDSLSFYYDENEYESFLKFFEYLHGKHTFDYDFYLSAYAEFGRFFADQDRDPPSFMKSPEELLQFLYDQNILCFKETSEEDGKTFIRWCFRERSPNNIAPKVQMHREYEIHYSLTSALNLGKEIKRKNINPRKATKSDDGFFEGRVKFYIPAERYGFIVQGDIPIDIYFNHKAFRGRISVRKGSRVRFRLDKDSSDRLIALDVMPLKHT